MSSQHIQQLLDTARREFDLHNDNVHTLSAQVTALNQELRNEEQKATEETRRIEKPHDVANKNFEEKESHYAQARTEFDKARAELDNAQKEFNKAQEKFQKTQKDYDKANQEHSGHERDFRSSTDKILSAVEFKRRRLEREIEQKQREARTEQVKAANARRDIEIFSKQLNESRRQSEKDNHPPSVRRLVA